MKKENILHKSIVTILVTMLFSCNNSELEKIKIFANQDEIPDIEVEQLETYYTTNGTSKGHIISPLVKIFSKKSIENPYYLFPDGAFVEFFNDSNQFESQIEANYAKYFNVDRIWEAKYNVKAINANGDTLQTEHIFVYEKEAKIKSEVQVQITSKDGMRIVGKDGFESNMDFTQYKFENVTGIFNINVEQDTSITSVPDSTLIL